MNACLLFMCTLNSFGPTSFQVQMTAFIGNSLIIYQIHYNTKWCFHSSLPETSPRPVHTRHADPIRVGGCAAWRGRIPAEIRVESAWLLGLSQTEYHVGLHAITLEMVVDIACCSAASQGWQFILKDPASWCYGTNMDWLMQEEATER